MQDPNETFNNIEHNTEMALLQSEKIAESVDNLEPIMEGVLVKTDEMVQEMKKSNDKPVNETKIIFEGVEMTEIRGRDGKDGEKGDKGDTGIQGQKGDKGDKGDQGEKGDKGEDGTNGYDGRDGLDGYNGVDGKDGVDGRDGIDGKDGKDGTEIKPEEIKQKLESLEVGLDYEKLSNVPDIAKVARMASSKTVSLIELDDVDYSGLTQTNGKYVLGGGGGSSAWGSITGTLSAQTDLQSALDAKLTTVTTDATLTGLGTDASPLSVVATSASDVAVTVRAATTATLAGTWTYNNGTAGVGATLTRTTNGALPNQDGVSLSDGDRFLIKNQASTLANGVYVLTQKGVTSVSPTIFTRATDADTTSQLDELVVTVSEGSTNRGTVWGQQTNNPTVGTSAIVFATVVSTSVTQATSGTQVINQIPLYTGTARQLTRGTANFKYNPLTDTITIRGVNMLFPTANVAGPLTNNGSGTLSWGSFITEGAPTQADRASVDITVLNTDYDELVGTQLTFGTVPNQTVLEYYNSSETPPSLPILGISLTYSQAQSLYAVGSAYSNGDTITIGSRTYTLQDTLTNVDGNIQRDVDDLVTAQNIVDAINLTGTPGTQYASAMTANTEVSATVSAPHFTAIALEYGPSGNSIALSTVSANGNAWNTSTLEGGSQPTTDNVAALTQDKIIKNYILADEKLINASYSSGDTLSVYVERPGTYGNGIAVDSTNDTAVTPATTTTLGGLDNGTTGSIGALRKGVVEVISSGNTIKIDSLFTAISDNIWMITSSTNNNLVGSAYDWTNV